MLVINSLGLSPANACYATWFIGTGKAKNDIQVISSLEDVTNQPCSSIQFVTTSRMKNNGHKLPKIPYHFIKHRGEGINVLQITNNECWRAGEGFLSHI